MFDWMVHGELEVLAYIREEPHYIHVMDNLAFPRVIV